MIFSDNIKTRIFSTMIVALLIVFNSPYRGDAQEQPAGKEQLTLEKAVDIALKNHPQLVSARNTVEAAKNRIGQAKAGNYPQINWSAGMSRNSSPFIPGQYNQYDNSFSLNQNIYDFNRVGTQVDIRTLDRQAAESDLENVTNNIILGVKQAYYELLRTRHARDISAETVKLFEEQLATAQGFFDVGIKPVYDVTTAQVNLSNAQVSLLRSRNAYTIARVTLNNAMGTPGAPPYEVKDDVSYTKSSLTLDDSLTKAFLNRPDLQTLARQREAAEKTVALLKKDYLPAFQGNASYGWSGEDFPLDKGWSVGVTMNMNLFSGFLTKNQVSEAEANLAVARSFEETQRQTIRLDVEQAFANLQTAEKSIEAAETTVRQAKENLDLAQGRYSVGVGTSLELTDAVLSLGNARLTLSGAIYDLKEAEADLQRAMGEK